MTHFTWTASQIAFRFYLDDAVPASATALAAQDINVSRNVGAANRCRVDIRIDETATGADPSVTFTLWAQKNGTGGYSQVTTGSSGIRLSSSTYDGSAISTGLLTGGTGTFLAGEVDSDGSTTALNFAGGEITEMQWCVELVDGDNTDGDYYDLHAYADGSELGTYSSTPRLTVSIPSTPYSEAVTAGSYSVTGQTAVENITSPISETVTAGSYSVTGQTAVENITSQISEAVTAGSYSVTGQTAVTNIVGAGFPTGWASKAQITINNSMMSGTVSQTDFVVFLTEDTLPSTMLDSDGSYPALNGGGDVRFSSDSAGTTQLPCEIIDFTTATDPANGVARIHVKIPTLAAEANTTIWVWWGKTGETQPGVTDTYGRNAVWSDYDMVVHGFDFVDASGNHTFDYTGGPTAGSTTQAKLYESIYFNSASAYHRFSASTYSLPSGSEFFTVSAWAYPDSAVNGSMWGWGGTNAQNGGYYGRVLSTGSFSCFTYNSGNLFNASNTSVVPTSAWSYLTHRVDSTNFNTGDVFYNGSDVTTTATSGSQSLGTDANYDFLCGARRNSGGYFDQFWNGYIEELRIRPSVLSDAWIEAEHNNQSAPATYITAGARQSTSGGDFTESVTAGSYSVTGQTASLTLTSNVSETVTAGSYSVTGQTAVENIGYSEAVTAGSYSVTGQTAVENIGYSEAVTAGSYSVTGQTAVETHGYSVAVTAGSYSVTGQTAVANVGGGYSEAVTAGSYSVTGQTAVENIGYSEAVTAGSYSVTGQTAVANVGGGYSEAATAGSYSVTGQTAVENVGYSEAVTAGSYSVTGQTASLTLTSNVSEAVTAGSYSVTGQTGAASVTTIVTIYADASAVAGNTSDPSGTWAASRNATDDNRYVYAETGITVYVDTYTGSSAPWWAIEQGLVQFNTSAIPASASIVEVTLSVYENDNDPTSTTIHVFANDFGSSFEGTDFIVGSTVDAATELATGNTNSGLSYNTFTSNAAFLAAINKGGYTRLAFVTDNEWTNTQPSSITYCNFQGAAQTNKPRLVIEYSSVPGEVSQVVTAGSYSVTGQTAVENIGYSEAATAGSYNVTGQTASLTLTSNVSETVTAGSYSVTGQTAVENVGYSEAATAGSYSVTGQTAIADIGGSYSETVTAGSYSVTGQTAVENVGYSEAATAGAYSVTGQTAVLNITTVGNVQLEATAGAYSVTGQTAVENIGYSEAATAGAYSVTGQTAQLTINTPVSLSATAGAYSATGQTAQLTSGNSLAVTAGSYSVTGQPAELILTGAGVSEEVTAGSYSVTGGVPSTFIRTGVIVEATAGSYSVTGQTPDLMIGLPPDVDLVATAGSYGVTGQVVNFVALIRPPNSNFWPSRVKTRRRIETTRKYPYAPFSKEVTLSNSRNREDILKSVARTVEQLVAAQRPVHRDLAEVYDRFINEPQSPLPGYATVSGSGSLSLTTTPQNIIFDEGTAYNYGAAASTSGISIEKTGVWDVTASVVVTGNPNIDVWARLVLNGATVAAEAAANTGASGKASLTMSVMGRYVDNTAFTVDLAVATGSAAVTYTALIKLVRVDMEPADLRTKRGLLG